MAHTCMPAVNQSFTCLRVRLRGDEGRIEEEEEGRAGKPNKTRRILVHANKAREGREREGLAGVARSNGEQVEAT